MLNSTTVTAAISATATVLAAVLPIIIERVMGKRRKNHARGVRKARQRD